MIQIQQTTISQAYKSRRITVMLDHELGFKKKMRCMDCGTILCGYEGSIVMVFEGEVQNLKRSGLELLCHRCKITWIIL